MKCGVFFVRRTDESDGSSGQRGHAHNMRSNPVPSHSGPGAGGGRSHRTHHGSGDSHRMSGSGSRHSQGGSAHYPQHHHRRTSDSDNNHQSRPSGPVLIPDAGGNMDLSNFAFPESVSMYDYSNAAGLVLSSSLDLPGMMDFSQQVMAILSCGLGQISMGYNGSVGVTWSSLDCYYAAARLAATDDDATAAYVCSTHQ